jgi:hypothetical protein
VRRPRQDPQRDLASQEPQERLARKLAAHAKAHQNNFITEA